MRRVIGTAWAIVRLGARGWVRPGGSLIHQSYVEAIYPLNAGIGAGCDVVLRV